MKWTFVDILFLTILLVLSLSEIPDHRNFLIRFCNFLLGILTHHPGSVISPEFEYESIEDGYHKDEGPPHYVCHNSVSIEEAPFQTNSSVCGGVEILQIIAVGKRNYNHVMDNTQRSSSSIVSSMAKCLACSLT